MGMMSRFKELDLVNSAWRTVDRGSWCFTGGGKQNHPKEKEKQEGKVVVCRGFTSSLRNNKWKAREKGKGTPD